MRSPLLLLGCALLSAARPLRAQDLPLDSLLRTPVSAAAKYAQTISEAAASVTIITADDIRRNGYRTLDELLRRVPGFYTTYDRNYAYLGVRGFGRPGDYNNRILLLIDGHTLNEGVFGSMPAGTDLALDPDVIDRVEVLHGPGSALYGTGAMLASVNIVTLNGRQLNGVRVAAGAGSSGLRRASAVAGGVLGRQTEVTVAGQWTEVTGRDLYFPEYDDPATSGGIAHDLDWDRHRSVLLGLRSGRWGVSAFAGTRSKGIPTGAYGIDFNDGRARTLDERRFVELRYGTAAAALAQLNLRGFASHYGYSGTYPYGQAYYDAASDDAIGGEARLRWDVGSRNRVVVGTEYRRNVRARYHSWTADTVFFDRNEPFGVFSLYGQDELQLTTSLTAVFGLRRDVRSDFSGSTSPRVAVLYHPARQTTLKLLYGEAFRVPNVYELIYEDAGTGFKRSSGLRPEQIRTHEAVWEQRVGASVFGSASLYHYRMRDLIDTRVDPADSLLQFANVALVISTGATLALDARFPGGSQAYVSYAYQHSQDGSTRQNLTNSPLHIAKAGASAPLGANALVSTEMRYESARRTVQGGTAGAHLWTGLHLLVGRGHVRRSADGGFLRNTDLSVTVANVFDARFGTPGGFEHLQTTIPQDGRTVSARLRMWL